MSSFFLNSLFLFSHLPSLTTVALKVVDLTAVDLTCHQLVTDLTPDVQILIIILLSLNLSLFHSPPFGSLILKRTCNLFAMTIATRNLAPYRYEFLGCGLIS